MLKFKIMDNITIFNKGNKPTVEEKRIIIGFLYEHLEKFGDAKEDITKAIDYSLEEYPSYGGFIMTYNSGTELAAAVVINKTGMEGYIPENILVYIATHNKLRGKGIGKKLMEAAINQAAGNIALHVEPDNPAKKLYERLGFTNKYLEMRLVKKK